MLFYDTLGQSYYLMDIDAKGKMVKLGSTDTLDLFITLAQATETEKIEDKPFNSFT